MLVDFTNRVLKGVWIVMCVTFPLFSNGQSTRVLYLKMEDAKHGGHEDALHKVNQLTGVNGVQKFGANIRAKYGRTPKPYSRINGLYTLEVQAGINVDSLIQAVKKIHNVVAVVEEPEAELLYIPNDPLLANQDYLEVIKAYKAWDVTRGSDQIRVAISDNGFDLNHEDLQNVHYYHVADPINGIDDDGNGYIDDFAGYDLADDDPDPSADLGNHGTAVTSAVTCDVNNSIGIAGVGHSTQFFPLKVFISQNGKSNRTYESIYYAAIMGYDVINLSWGGTYKPDPILQDIINFAVIENDVVVVAACGNNNTEELFYPASLDNVLSVGATNFDDSKGGLSTYNHKVDLMAPGIGVYCALVGDNYGPQTGTSFASPLVAGAAALVRHVFPEMSALQVMEQLRMTTDYIYNVGNNINYYGQLGTGRLNVYRAVTETSTASVRVSDHRVSSRVGEHIYAGDTILIWLDFTCILRDVNNLQINASLESGSATITRQFLTAQQMSSGDTLTGSWVEMIIGDEVDYEQQLSLRLDLTDDNGYVDFEYVDLYTAPSYYRFDNDSLTMVVNSAGGLGFRRVDRDEQPAITTVADGIFFKSAGLLIGNHADSISDNVVEDFNFNHRTMDWQEETKLRAYARNDVDFYIRNIVNDAEAAHGLGLRVEQEHLQWKDLEYQSFIVSEYFITNTHSWTRNDMVASWFLDVDILGVDGLNEDKNFVSWDEQDAILYAYQTGSNRMIGLTILSAQASSPNAIDVRGGDGSFIDITTNGLLNESAKHLLMTTQKTSAGGASGNDVAMMLNVPLGNMSPKSSVKVAIAVLVGADLADLKLARARALEKYQEFLTQPAINNTLVVCENAQVQLGNTQYVQLYEDAAATQLIAEGLNLNWPGFDRDSIFYYREIKEGSSSDFYALHINISNSNIGFRADPEILYLGEIPGNRVEFFDESLEASSWQWDFDNGYRSTLQNPASFFNSIGEYDVQFQAINVRGCVASISQTYVVSERSPAPDIDDQVICRGDRAVISAANSSSLRIYTSGEIPILLHEGATWETPALTQTISYRVSSLQTGAESAKVEVIIAVDDVQAKFQHRPELENLDAQSGIVLDDVSTQAISRFWRINDQDQGSDSKLVYDFGESSSLSVALTIVSPNGCLDQTSETITFQQSDIPLVDPLVVCRWESATVIPDNGKYFAFFSDEHLTNLIGKGAELEIERIRSDTSIYVVGITDYLAGDVAVAEINVEPYHPEIVTYRLSALSAQFSANTDDVMSYAWHVAGQLVDESRDPVFSFEGIGEYLIELVSQSSQGCMDTTAIVYSIAPPTAIDNALSKIEIFPNPTSQILYCSEPIFACATCFDLISIAGERIPVEIIASNSIDISTLSSGMYQLVILLGNDYRVFRVMKH